MPAFACSRTTTVASQCWFLAAAGLATFARVQYAALDPGLPRRRARRRAVPAGRARRADSPSSRSPSVSGPSWPLVVGGAPARAIRARSRTSGSPADTLGWTIKTDGLLLVVTGAAIAPGALAWASCASGDQPTERAQGSPRLSLFLVGLLVIAAAMISVDTLLGPLPRAVPRSSRSRSSRSASSAGSTRPPREVDRHRALRS